MPAFARASAPRYSDRRKHDCRCGGKCGSCSARKRDQRMSPAGGGRGHDFARIAVDRKCPGDGHDVDGAATCNIKTGQIEICINRETCAGKFTTRHEEVHKEHRQSCCERAHLCWQAAATDAEKTACSAAYDTWALQSQDWSECEALKFELEAIPRFMARNCENKSAAPGIGATIGAGLGLIGGTIGGAFLGQSLFGSALGATGGGVLGAFLGGSLGSAAGALLGVITGLIVKAAQKEDVSSDCCKDLETIELAGAKNAMAKTCKGNPEPVDCPFDANGKIIAPAPTPTATFNQATPGEAAA